MNANSPQDPAPNSVCGSLTQKQLEDFAFFQRYTYLKQAELTGAEMAAVMGFASDSGVYARINSINDRGFASPRDLVEYAALRFWGQTSISINRAAAEISNASDEKICPIHASAILKIGVAQGLFNVVRKDVYRSSQQAPKCSIHLLANSRPAGEAISESEAACLLSKSLGFPVDPEMASVCLEACKGEGIYREAFRGEFRRTGEPLDFAYSNIWERSLVLATSRTTRYINLGEARLNSEQFDRLRAPLIKRGGEGWPALAILSKYDTDTLRRSGIHDNGERNYGFMVVIHRVGTESCDLEHDSSATILALHRADAASTIVRPTTATLDKDAIDEFEGTHIDILGDDLRSRFLSAAAESNSGGSTTLYRAALIYGKVR